jgi:RNA polymerase sigma-70 factor (ECF subfamily)
MSESASGEQFLQPEFIKKPLFDREREIEKLKSENVYGLILSFILNNIKGEKPGATVIDDLVQTTYLKALEGIGIYRGESPLEPWMYRIASNEVANYYRAKSMENDKEALSKEGDVIKMVSTESDGKDREKQSLNIDFLSRAGVDLSAQEKTIISLKLQDKSTEEIAKELGISSGTVKTHFSEALKKMKRRVKMLGE